jgi:uncharacterized protein (TIGR02246 family)
MRRIANLAGFILLLFLFLQACTPAPEPEADLRAEEQVLRELWEQIRVLYENRDAKAMADLCDDPMLMSGGVVRGREGIQEHWESFLGSLGETQINTLEELDLEFVTPDVAIHQAHIEFTNLPPDVEGNPQAPKQYWASNVLVKKAGRWMRKAAFLREITAALPSG